MKANLLQGLSIVDNQMIIMPMGGKHGKGTTGAKVKVIFQGLHMTCVIFVLVYIFKFYILDTQFNIVC
jgi:hypothetical protein